MKGHESSWYSMNDIILQNYIRPSARAEILRTPSMPPIGVSRSRNPFEVSGCPPRGLTWQPQKHISQFVAKFERILCEEHFCFLLRFAHRGWWRVGMDCPFIRWTGITIELVAEISLTRTRYPSSAIATFPNFAISQELTRPCQKDPPKDSASLSDDKGREL